MGKGLTTIRNRTTKVPKGRKTTGRWWSPERTEPLLMWNTPNGTPKDWRTPKEWQTQKVDGCRESLSPRRVGCSKSSFHMRFQKCLYCNNHVIDI